MTSAEPTPNPAAPQPGVSFGDGAGMTIDLSAPPETGGQAFGRIVGGLLLFIVAGLAAIGCLVAYLGAAFVPSLWEWADLLGDVLLFIGAVLLGLAGLGFEIMRRGRKKRAEGTPALDAVAGFLDATGIAEVETTGMDDYNPNRIPPPSAAQPNKPAKPETHL